MGVICIGTLVMTAWYPQSRDKITISFISNSVRFTDSPIAFWGIATLFILTGIVAFAILFRTRLAYHLGIAYCMVAFAFLGTLTAMGIGVVNDPYATFMLLALIFGGLGAYFFRQRNEWKNG